MKSHHGIPTYLLWFGAFSLPAPTAFASEQCPAEVSTQQSVKTSHSGWTVFKDETRFPLVSIRFSEGEPSDMAWLAPSNSKSQTVQYWFLPKSSRGYWIACGYGSTSMLLSLRLPSSTTKCTVWLDKDYLPPVALRYECK